MPSADLCVLTDQESLALLDTVTLGRLLFTERGCPRSSRSATPPRTARS